jgi:Sulfotransferase family
VTDSIPLIISGAPRSGTSLFYNLFDGHPDVSWLVDEGYLFKYLDDLGPEHAALFLKALPSNAEALVAGLRDKQILPPMHIPYVDNRTTGTVADVRVETPWDEQRFRAALAKPRKPGFDGLWRYLAAAYLAGEGAAVRRYVCMKSPDFAQSARAALSLIGTARAIVILRDPLHAIDSLKRSRELRGDKLLTWPLIAQSAADFLEMSARLDAMDADRLMVLRYEELTGNPEATMRRVAHWLDIPYDATLIEPTMRGQRWPGISSFATTYGIETAPAERPIQALDADELAFLRDALAGYRAKYGFDRRQASASLSVEAAN